jgi:hypothetical protein
MYSTNRPLVLPPDACPIVPGSSALASDDEERARRSYACIAPSRCSSALLLHVRGQKSP